MPQPINVQDARLAQYLRLFSGVFSLPQWKYFVIVLLGLVHCDERRTLSALLRHVAVGVTIFGVCYFLRRAPWSVDALTAVRQTHFYAQVAPWVAAAHAMQRTQRPRRRGHPQPTVVTGYLIIDDSTHAKRYARAQEGLGHHYSGTEKKVVNGHSMYQSVYLLAGRQLPLTPGMYRQRVTCEAEGVPFVSKIDMAYAEVTTFEPAPDTQTHWLIDSWYMAKRIWRAARQRDWDVTGGLKFNRAMRRIEPDGTRRWLRVDAYATTLTADDFEPVIWPTEAGDKVVYAHLVKTWVRKLGPCQVLIVKLDPAERTLPQSLQHDFRPTPQCIGLIFDEAQGDLAGVDEGHQDLSPAGRQPQLETAQANQPLDLLPPGPPTFGLAPTFGRGDFVPALGAAVALNPHPSDPQPTGQQHPNPVEYPVAAVLPDTLSLALRALARSILPTGSDAGCQRLGDRLRSRRPIAKHVRQCGTYLLQIVAERAFRHPDTTGHLSGIHLVQRSGDGLDFFVQPTQSVGHDTTSELGLGCFRVPILLGIVACFKSLSANISACFTVP
jgi:hypothetical protein